MAGRGPIRIRIVGDNRGLKQALSQTERSLSGLDRGVARVERGFSKLSRASVALAGLAAVTAAFKSTIEAASRLEQAQGAVAAVFKSSAPSMQAAAEAAVDLGLSQADYLESASKLGAQLKNQGTAQKDLASTTQNLIGISADLAATFGGPVSEAVDAVSALFRGETDPIERYGVSIKQSMVTAKAALDGVSESQARLRLLVEQSADAQGQLAREADTYAVKQQRASAALENAQASVGNALLPAAASVLDIFGDIADAVSKIPQGVSTAAVQIALVSAAFVKVAQFAGTAAKSAQAFATAVGAGAALGNMQKLGSAAAGVATAAGGLAAAVPWVTALAVAASAIYIVFDQIRKSAEQAQIGVSQFNAEISTGGLSSATLSRLVEQAQAASAAMEEVRKATQFQQVGSGTGGAGAGLGRWIREQLNPDIASYQKSLENLSTAVDNYWESETDPLARAGNILNLREQMIDAGYSEAEVLGIIGPELEEAADAQKRFGDATVEAAQNIQGAIGEYERLGEAAKNVGAGFEAFGAVGQVIAETDKLGQSFLNLKKSVEEGGISGAVLDFENFSDAAVQSRSNIAAVAAQAQQLALANIQAGGSFELVTSNLLAQRQALIDQIAATTGNRDAAREYVNTLLGTPKQIITNIRAAGLEDANQRMKAFADAIDDVPRTVETIINAVNNGEEATKRQKRLLNDIPKTYRTTIRAIVQAKDDPEKLKKAIQGVPKEWRSELRADIREGKSSAELLDKLINNIKQDDPTEIDADVDQAKRDVQSLQDRINGLTGKTVPITISINVQGTQKEKEAAGLVSLIPGVGIPIPDEEDVTPFGRIGPRLGSSLFAGLSRSGKRKSRIELQIVWDVVFGNFPTDAVSKYLARQRERAQKELDRVQTDLQKAKSAEQKNEQQIARLKRQRAKAQRLLNDALRQEETINDAINRKVQIRMNRLNEIQAQGQARLAQEQRLLGEMEARGQARLAQEQQRLSALESQVQAVEQLASTVSSFNLSSVAQGLTRRSALLEQLESVRGNPLWAEQIQRELNKIDPAQAIRDQLSITDEFVTNLGTLGKQGLDPRLLQDIAQLGAAAGNDLAGALVASPELRGLYQRNFDEMNRIASEAAQGVIGSQRDAVYQGTYEGLLNSRDLQQLNVGVWESFFAREVWTGTANGFKWARAVQQNEVAAWSAPFEQAVYEGGVEGWKDLERRLRREKPIRIKFDPVFPKNVKLSDLQPSRRSAAPQQVHIHVGGALVDPEGAAQAIRRVLDDHDTLVGGRRW